MSLQASFLKDKRRQIMTTLTPCPQDKNVVPTYSKKTDSYRPRVEISLQSFLLEEDYYNTNTRPPLRKTTMIKHRMHHFKKLNLSILFVHGYKKLVSLPHATLIIPMCIHFNHKVMITEGPRSSIRTKSWKSNHASSNKTTA
ncbi:hypothetical protein Tco_0875335 [Tanacetum coccineum]|uniref:Uncharacterized protein n=1 Tax=Tanacetum coccineum TaxID=301880 RepID=A0ABQ5BUU9_9ASTR